MHSRSRGGSPVRCRNSGLLDNTIRLWDPDIGAETAKLETDAPIHCIAALPAARLVAGDAIGRLHWLEIVD
jgi:hypothetical protein